MTYSAGSVIGDYLVLGAVGSGGMGTVYKVQHAITRRVEAIKLLLSGRTDPEREQRFVREMQLQARLHHPNIAAVYNAFRYYDEFFLVLEFVDGEPLQSVLARGRLPLETGLHYARQALSALGYAHAHGVVHRDIAPSNMIVAPDGVLKLTDFGLARAASDVRLTHSGAPLGSPWYMSPEQVRGEIEIDARSDIYSLGAVLYEMATGFKPFDLANTFDAMRAQVETAPLAPIERAPEVSPLLNQVILTAMAKDPGRRFQSAEEFYAAMEPVQPARPLEAGLALAQPAAGTLIPAYARSSELRTFARYRMAQTTLSAAAGAVLLVGGYGAYRAGAGRLLSRPNPVAAMPAPPTVVQPVVANLQTVPAPVPQPTVASVRPSVARHGTQKRVGTKNPDDFHLASAATPRSKKEGNRFLRALHRVMPFHKQETT